MLRFHRHLTYFLDTPLATKLLGRPIYTTFQEPSLAETCAGWIRNCEQSHTQCSNYKYPRIVSNLSIPTGTQPSSLPLEILEITDESVRLVPFGDHDKTKKPPPFATLMCYLGAFKPSFTREQLHEGVRLQDMTRNLQDIITLVRRLGFCYLWETVLCSNDDISWCIDSAKKMLRLEYIANGSLNIVAHVRDPMVDISTARDEPRFPPISLNSQDDPFSFGWLSTDAYCDPQGLNMLRYPDSWKYRLPPTLVYDGMQQISVARRNLVIQMDERETSINSQLYLRCREEVHWEGGRVRPGVMEESALDGWYHTVEEHSRTWSQVDVEGRARVKMALLGNTARHYGKSHPDIFSNYITGLWGSDILRGLLWRAEEAAKERDMDVPSYSWATVSGGVKHMWPSNATLCAEVLETCVSLLQMVDPYFPIVWKGSSLIIRSTLIRIEAATGGASDLQVEDIKIKGPEEGKELRIRYFLDFSGDGGLPKMNLYALKITRRIALLLRLAGTSRIQNARRHSGKGNGLKGLFMERVGIMVVAKADTRAWEALSEPQKPVILV